VESIIPVQLNENNDVFVWNSNGKGGSLLSRQCIMSYYERGGCLRSGCTGKQKYLARLRSLFGTYARGSL
jgi:hypothetical protein